MLNRNSFVTISRQMEHVFRIINLRRLLGLFQQLLRMQSQPVSILLWFVCVKGPVQVIPGPDSHSEEDAM